LGEYVLRILYSFLTLFIILISVCVSETIPLYILVKNTNNQAKINEVLFSVLSLTETLFDEINYSSEQESTSKNTQEINFILNKINFHLSYVSNNKQYLSAKQKLRYKTVLKDIEDFKLKSTIIQVENNKEQKNLEISWSKQYHEATILFNKYAYKDAVSLFEKAYKLVPNNENMLKSKIYYRIKIAHDLSKLKQHIENKWNISYSISLETLKNIEHHIEISFNALINNRKYGVEASSLKNHKNYFMALNWYNFGLCRSKQNRINDSKENFHKALTYAKKSKSEELINQVNFRLHNVSNHKKQNNYILKLNTLASEILVEKNNDRSLNEKFENIFTIFKKLPDSDKQYLINKTSFVKKLYLSLSLYNNSTKRLQTSIYIFISMKKYCRSRNKCHNYFNAIEQKEFF